MEAINKNELIGKMQKLYDSFITSSNRSFEHSGNPDLDGTSRYGWERQSEAYESCAIFLDQSLAAAGVFIKSETADRRMFMEQKQREMSAADAETEFDDHESVFYAAV